MYCQLDFVEVYLRDHTDQLRRQAENERLVALAIGPGRPLRRRIADVLVTAAAWLDDQSPRPVATDRVRIG